MEKLEYISLLVELPNEILIQILDDLTRRSLSSLVRVNKRLHGVAQYVLEHKKKIRLCGDHLRALVVSLPTKYDDVYWQTRADLPMFQTARQALLINSVLMGSPKLGLGSTAPSAATAKITVRGQSFENGGKVRFITLVATPSQKKYRQKLWINAVTTDLCVFVVDPAEIDEFSADIKEMIFGACFMMSARNVIVAIDMQHILQTNTSPVQVYNEARTKISKLLNRTVGMCYKFVPVDVKTGVNCAENLKPEQKFDWFSGPTLRQLILEDQLRTNFDEIEFQKLCEKPLKIQLHTCHRIRGIGMVPEGRVLSGVLKPGLSICMHPNRIVATTFSIESTFQFLPEAKPGNVIGFNIKGGFNYREVLQRFCYVVKNIEGAMVNRTIAFRASIVVMKSDRFSQHQVYNVLYGSSRIRCILWWIFPENEKNHDKSERKYKMPRESGLQKPIKSEMTEYTYRIKLREYKEKLKKEKESFVRWQGQSGSNFDRPAKKQLKKATAILLPLAPYDIEPYKATLFEKNTCGKVMLIEKSSIVGVGRVDLVLNISAKNFEAPTNIAYRKQYNEVVAGAGSLFNLPKEQKFLKLFLEHVTNNAHAKKSIETQNSLSSSKAGLY